MGRVGKPVEEKFNNLNSDGASPTRKSTPGKKATRPPRTPRKRKFDEVNTDTPTKSSDGGPALPVVKTEAELLGMKVEKDDIKTETGNDSEVNVTDLEDFHDEDYHLPPAGTTDLLVSATELDV
ncbi:uncharacterized protein N7469_006202 [Penicillium citrinum]|uniref:Uncharacterized protein n=1 Tax=Penicillium citrinum TaxID=5077 RepID=A0A9W9NXK1_PENCI|nr:uncharacterized protein N7469_006202 [Penicillium citrinum]KAJ5231614.1 hypothetical protein N7469_006202 [Penicillium citrinum]